MKITIRKPLGFSEIGRKDNQEDCIYPSMQVLDTANRFFILCDGMGGHDAGEVASRTVCQTLGMFLETHWLACNDEMTPQLFGAALAHTYDELDKQDTHAAKKMGTTMACLCLHDKGYLVAHIGDSRIYHVRPSCFDAATHRLGILYQSADHSLVNDLLKAGELTEEEVQNFPKKNIITRAMQPNLEHRCKADIFTFSDVKKGDYFFLCSDGIMEQLTNDKLCSILADSSWTDEKKLLEIRKICEGKTKDNHTCILIPVDEVTSVTTSIHTEDEVMVASVEVKKIKGIKMEAEEISNEKRERDKRLKRIVVACCFIFILILLGIIIFLHPAI